MAKRTYYAVYVKADLSPEQTFHTFVGPNWVHHLSLDSMTEAREEADYCRRQGEQVKIVKQDW